ncbi:unnamed protein product [Amoebophrya sp. A25]|nr:unnamed protein product [Amoebophrya sp. A25]|eukprot:GSA25T00005875001.1
MLQALVSMIVTNVKNLGDGMQRTLWRKSVPQCDSVRRRSTRRRQGNGLSSASILHSRGFCLHDYSAAAVRALLTLVIVCKTNRNLGAGLVVEEVAVTHPGER